MMKSFIKLEEKELQERYDRICEQALLKCPSIEYLLVDGLGYDKAFKHSPTAVKRSVRMLAGGTHILRFLECCRLLNLDPFDLEPLESFHENRKENLLENRLLSKYCDLNYAGRKRLFKLADSIWEDEKYRRI